MQFPTVESFRVHLYGSPAQRQLALDGFSPRQNGSQGPYNMGVQSQKRRSAIKKQRQNAKFLQRPSSRRKTVQRSVDNVNERAFDPKKDCQVCLAVATGKRKPHRAHHKRCEKNQRTGGGSETTVRSNQESERLRIYFVLP